MGNGDGSSSAALMTSSCLMLVLLLLLLCVSSSSSRRAMAAEYELEEYWSSAATGTFTKDSDGSISLGGACGYGDSYHRGYGQYTTALSSKLFKKGGSCGGCYEVRCVDHILWCLAGSPTVVVTATDFCPPNYGLPGDYGGWCNPPLAHFEMSYSAFVQIAEERSDIIPLQYRRVNCERRGGMRFTLSGGSSFLQALITNVAMDGQVVAVKVKGSKTGWIPMGRNWGQNWQCNVDLKGQPLSFEVSINSGKTLTSYNVAPPDWQFGQTFEGKQFQDK